MKNLAVILGLIVFLLVVIWNTRKSTKEINKSDFPNIMEGAAQEAIVVAKQDYQIELDLNPESIEKVEEILDKLHEQNQKSAFPKSRMAQEVILWGAYTGEVIRKLHPAHWEKDSELGGKGSYPIVFDERKQESFPVRWVHKRIVNGPEDNVWHKFQVLILADQESLEVFDLDDLPDAEPNN